MKNEAFKTFIDDLFDFSDHLKDDNLEATVELEDPIDQLMSETDETNRNLATNIESVSYVKSLVQKWEPLNQNSETKESVIYHSEAVKAPIETEVEQLVMPRRHWILCNNS